MILCIAAHDIGKWDSPRPGADMTLKIKQEKGELIPMLCGLDKELKVFPCRKSEIDHQIANVSKAASTKRNNNVEMEDSGDIVYCCPRHREMGLPTSWCRYEIENQTGET